MRLGRTLKSHLVSHNVIMYKKISYLRNNWGQEDRHRWHLPGSWKKPLPWQPLPSRLSVGKDFFQCFSPRPLHCCIYWQSWEKLFPIRRDFLLFLPIQSLADLCMHSSLKKSFRRSSLNILHFCQITSRLGKSGWWYLIWNVLSDTFPLIFSFSINVFIL